MNYGVLSSLFMVSAMAVMLVVLTFIPKPGSDEWKPFRKAMYFFMLACTLLFAVNIRTMYVSQSGVSEVRSAITICVSFYQALLFTALPIVMLDAKSRFIRMVTYQVAGLTVLSVLVVGVAICLPVVFFSWVFYAMVAAYLLLCMMYSWVFRRVYVKTVRQLEAYYDDDMRLRTHWMLRMFCVALAIGMLAPIGAASDEFYNVFRILASLLYAYLLSCVLRYIMTGQYVVRANSDVNEEQEEKAEAAVMLNARYQELEHTLNDWIEHRGYTNTEIGVDEIAHELGTNYATLCHYFSEVKGTTFRNWRTQLRIEESKRIMREHGEISIKDVAQMSGFSDRANFHRMFQKQEGVTPSEYRTNHLSPA